MTTPASGGPLAWEELTRLRSITTELRARRERLRELIGVVTRLEKELDGEVAEVQALTSEARLIVRGSREVP